ncbi:FHA domain-containing protein [Kangiella sp. HZ709]|uniref:FHA domain-containing protein n=1 Tax=Kangiella sp. HZ709 TaxID=2666328 RepID=UPI0012B0BD18|nr:FHA domain-containing protein [Kangiella sp. HZ709]MRX28548.1 FHA domain-containing protein [Kangiella sp. HZ709]
MSSEKKPTDKNQYREDKAGPQGTLVFDSKKVDQMIAEEIQRQEDDGTKVAALVATSKPHVGEQFVLVKGKNIIGRGKGNNVTIYDPAASSTHAQITYQGGEWKILNLLSSNGTIVNGEKITDRVLSFGDRIQVGHTEFLFTLVDESDVVEMVEKPATNWFAFSAVAIAAISLLVIIFLLI